MKVIFLAAGKGSRIYKNLKTNKCLIKINNKYLINHVIKNIKDCGIDDISIVTGFNSSGLRKSLKDQNLKYIHNSKFRQTEMTYSFELGLKKYNSDILFLYSDIFIEKKIIQKILQNESKDIVLPILKNWRQIWKIRKKNIYDDAESLKIKNNKITNIGNKLKKREKVNGQYMGIILVRKNIRLKVLKFLKEKSFKKKHLTYFLNELIKKKINIHPLKVAGKWYEFDDKIDLANFKKNKL
jgi:choline kinase